VLGPCGAVCITISSKDCTQTDGGRGARCSVQTKRESCCYRAAVVRRAGKRHAVIGLETTLGLAGELSPRRTTGCAGVSEYTPGIAGGRACGLTSGSCWLDVGRPGCGPLPRIARGEVVVSSRASVRARAWDAVEGRGQRAEGRGQVVDLVSSVQRPASSACGQGRHDRTGPGRQALRGGRRHQRQHQHQHQHQHRQRRHRRPTA
jgi:hypothetical protein